MTREEAIEFGKMWLELQEDCKDSNTYEFFKMAIEALQQEPTYTSEVAQKAYEDGKKDGYIQRKIETIADNLTSSKIKKAIENLPKVKPQEPCEDAVSRKAVIDAIYANGVWENEYNLTSSKIKKAVENLPSITPQEPRKGHWIMTGDYFTGAYESIDYVKCSCCGEESLEEGNYCPNCGADMREEQK